MSALATGLVILLAVLIVAAASAFFVRRYLALRAERMITCPETREAAVVRLDARRALTRPATASALRLSDCTRWPEKRDCDQACLSQIEASPDGCLVRHILTSWYKQQTCSFCGHGFDQIHWVDQKPALMNSDHGLVEWDDVRPEKIAEVMATHTAVCWKCAGVESFRRQHPELVIDRPWKRGEREARQV
jgi:hypothetical protein